MRNSQTCLFRARLTFRILCTKWTKKKHSKAEGYQVIFWFPVESYQVKLLLNTETPQGHLSESPVGPGNMTNGNPGSPAFLSFHRGREASLGWISQFYTILLFILFIFVLRPWLHQVLTGDQFELIGVMTQYLLAINTYPISFDSRCCRHNSTSLHRVVMGC